MRAVILCGGHGLRLRPLTSESPKPLIPLHGRPIIDYVVDHLRSNDIENIVVAAGYRSEMLVRHFQDSAVEVVDTGDQDILGRIRQIDDGMEDEILVLYGDTLSDVNLLKLFDSHRRANREATVTVWPLRSSFGIFKLNQQSLVSWYREKPVLDFWVNIGYFVLTRRALDGLEGSSTFQEALGTLAERGELHAYRHHGLHITVNTRAELEDAESALSRWPSVG